MRTFTQPHSERNALPLADCKDLKERHWLAQEISSCAGGADCHMLLSSLSMTPFTLKSFDALLIKLFTIPVLKASLMSEGERTIRYVK